MQNIKTAILSTAYFPPIQYISKLIRHRNVIIEKHENYSKQSYRNRCIIYSANGVQTLSIPVKKKTGKVIITDIEIDYTENWQTIHLRSIDSAYRSSPFYEFYIDAFLAFFKKKYKFLIDLNIEITHKILNEIEEKSDISFSNKYIDSEEENDFRETIHPKKNKQTKDTDFVLKPYTQVFSDKFGFKENLSILDLLFNEGPNTICFL